MLINQAERSGLSENSDLLERPHFVEMLPGESILDGGDFDELFSDAAPLLERVADGLGFTVEDVYGWATANTIVPVIARDAAGTVTLGGWVRMLTLGDTIKMRAAVAFVAPSEGWPSLVSLESLLAKTCAFGGMEAAVIWAPGGLPDLDGWQAMDFSEIPPLRGPALVQFPGRSAVKAA
jgi:hypothetical protein